MTYQEYTRIHHWVRRNFGKANKCESCNVTEGRIEWSNKSQDYLYDATDWQMLCKRCHAYYDRNNPRINRPVTHPLEWDDEQLAYMVNRLQKGVKVSNLATIYRLMGYDGRNPTEAFKKRVEKLKG